MAKHHLKFGKKRVKLPASAPLRIGIGVLLVVGGLAGFLPILGFWMVPLGLIVLSVDIPAVRRFRRKAEVMWGRWRRERRAAKTRRERESAQVIARAERGEGPVARKAAAKARRRRAKVSENPATSE